MEEKFINEVLSDKVVDVLDAYNCSYGRCENNGTNYAVEIEFKTSQGGDNVFTVYFDSDKSFLKDLSAQARDFDVDEHVSLWLDAKKERPDVCPLNARQLVRDGYEVRRTLRNIAKDIRKAI